MDTLPLSSQLKNVSAALSTAKVLARNQANDLLASINDRYVPRPVIQAAFKYVPFGDPANQIRLLRLRFNSDEDRIVGHLETHSASAVPPYVAISYTWGDGKPKTAIRLDGCVFSVGANCYHALRSVSNWWRRKQYKQPVGVISELLQATRITQPPDLRVWIDAICIDQANLEEKSHQVQKMGAIFMEAKTVCAWMGRDDQASNDFFEACSEHQPSGIPRSELHDYIAGISNLTTGTRVFLTSNTVEDADESGPAYDYWDPFRSASKNDTIRLPTLANIAVEYHNFDACLRFVRTSKLASAIPALLRRTYFTRLWIIQELAFSRLKSEVVALCGDEDSVDIEAQEMFIVDVLWGLRAGIDWQRARNKLLLTEKLPTKMDDSAVRVADPAEIDEVSAWIASVIATPGFALLRHTREFDRDYVAATLRELVFQYRDWQCSDPRDRVYGLLHLAAYTAHAKHQRIQRAQAAVHKRPLAGFLEPFETCSQCREDVPVSVNYGRSTFDLAVILCEYTFHARTNLFSHMNTIAALLELTMDPTNVESIRTRFPPKNTAQLEIMRNRISNARNLGDTTRRDRSSVLSAALHLPLSQHKSGQLCVHFLPFDRDADIILDCGQRGWTDESVPTSSQEARIFVGQSRFLCAVVGAAAREGDILLVFNEHGIRFAIVVRPDQKERYTFITYGVLSGEIVDLMEVYQPRMTICHRRIAGVCGASKATSKRQHADESQICDRVFELLFGYRELFLIVTCLGNLTLEKATENGSRKHIAEAFAGITLASYGWMSGQSASIPPGMYRISQALTHGTDVSSQRQVSVREWLDDPRYFWTVDGDQPHDVEIGKQGSLWSISEIQAKQESLLACPEFIGFQKREESGAQYFPSQAAIERHTKRYSVALSKRTFTQSLHRREWLATALPPYPGVAVENTPIAFELDAEEPYERRLARVANCAAHHESGSAFLSPHLGAIELAA